MVVRKFLQSWTLLLFALCWISPAVGKREEFSDMHVVARNSSAQSRELAAPPNLDGYVDHTISGSKLTNGIYPSTTLSCYSSYTKPDRMLICPESRSKFCVKELSTLKEDLCGQSQYFGDEYLQNLCVLKKCSAECVEGQYPFTYGGLLYVRIRYCCQEDYCNSSLRNVASPALLVMSSIVLVSVFLCIAF
jgi:hypothetical protein